VNAILSKAPLAIKAAVAAINKAEDLTLENGLELESQLFGETCGTDDFKGGTNAFLEKRKAVFNAK